MRAQRLSCLFSSLLVCSSLAAHEVPGGGLEHPAIILATYDGGELTAHELAAYWKVTDFPVPERINLFTHDAMNEGEVIPPGVLNAVKDATLSEVILHHPETLGIEQDKPFELRALSLMAGSLQRDLAEDLEERLGEPTEEELATILADMPPVKEPEESRRAQVIVLPGASHSDEVPNPLVEEILGTLDNGTEFASLAQAYSQGPGMSTDGHLPLSTKERLPSEDLGEAVFLAPESGEVYVHSGSFAVYIVVIHQVFLAGGVTEEDRLAMARNRWKSRALEQRLDDRVNTWNADLGVEIMPDFDDPESMALRVGDQGWTWSDMVALDPGMAQNENRLAVVSRLANMLVIGLKGMELLPKDLAVFLTPAARSRVASAEWERALRETLPEPTEEELREYFESAQAKGAYRTSYSAEVTVIRVVPAEIGETARSAEALERWGDLDAVATRLRAELEGYGDPEDLRERVNRRNSASDFVIELKDLGRLGMPPTYMGQEFYLQEQGEVGEILSPREDVRLMYTITSRNEVRPLTYDAAKPSVRRAVSTLAWNALFDQKREELIDRFNMELKYPGAPD